MSELTPGATLRLIGAAGALFVVTVGKPFSAEYISAQIGSGEWKHAPKARKRNA
ncbi:hypothetical protein OG911_25300 [Streptomyces sp. NBC_00208]|uniref:hypothetical protein n=1 Tax=Streptomyces sp. NBC_00208 TaxID=2975681 RepID=UPI002E2D0866|nr:hypothetical protein [Streptomyces sp. NBC_00208]